jgi:hypothetical protein
MAAYVFLLFKLFVIVAGLALTLVTCIIISTENSSGAVRYHTNNYTRSCPTNKNFPNFYNGSQVFVNWYYYQIQKSVKFRNQIKTWFIWCFSIMTSGDDCNADGSIYFRNETCSFLVKHLGVCGLTIQTTTQDLAPQIKIFQIFTMVRKFL